MNEREYNKQVLAELRSYGAHAEGHEDKWRKSIPDVSFAYSGKDGWIELKWKNRFPSELTGKAIGLRLDQIKWLRERNNRGGGNCHVLLGTPTEHLLFYGAICSLEELVPIYRSPNLGYIIDHVLRSAFRR